MTESQMPLLKTCFYDFHVRQGAKMVDFGGWAMPLFYRGIRAEHEQTRLRASVFDVSHMGRLHFSGPDALQFLQHICTRNLANAAVGQSLYSLICNPSGGVLDDVIVSRFENHWLMVCNASNRHKLLAWFQANSAGFNYQLKDETQQTAMIAIQGPKVLALLDSLLPEPVSAIKRYHFITQSYLIAKFTVFRSGYTGEDGVEIICGSTIAQMALNMLFKPGRDTHAAPLQPAGLGARDTLRMEAGMPLYGHELSATMDPIAAGLQWAVATEKEFIGAPALAEIRRNGPARRLVGLAVSGPRIARQGMELWAAGRRVGAVTSGTESPTLKHVIAMAYVDADAANEGAALEIDLRGTRTPATVVSLPFYKLGGPESARV
ncbi:MAG: glycine cleavage system aminomethyltransferase GcvT [Phycisphaerae bacterium]